jgi:hypothetical protein
MRALFFAAFLFSCAHVDAPVLPPGTSDQHDLFTGQAVSCSEPIDVPPTSSVTACADVEAVDDCFVGLAGVRTVPEIVCAARDLSEVFHIAQRKGDELSGRRAGVLDAWFRRHGVFILGD